MVAGMTPGIMAIVLGGPILRGIIVPLGRLVLAGADFMPAGMILGIAPGTIPGMVPLGAGAVTGVAIGAVIGDRITTIITRPPITTATEAVPLTRRA